MAKEKHGFRRVSPGYPKNPQTEALLAAGVPEERIIDYEKWEDEKRTLRTGEVLRVFGLDRLGEDFDEMVAVLEYCAEKGLKVLNVESGRYADPGPTADIIVARQRLVGESRRHSNRTYKAIGNKLRGRKKKWAIADSEAATIWKDRRIATNPDAAAEISRLNKAAGGKKITVTMCQRRFGGSGRPAGWPRGRKGE